MKLTLTLAAIALSSSAFLVHAADEGRGERMAAELQKRFAAADVNGDGRLTKEEAKDRMPRVYQHFDEIDSAHAGSVALADIVRFARAQRGSRGNR